MLTHTARSGTKPGPEVSGRMDPLRAVASAAVLLLLASCTALQRSPDQELMAYGVETRVLAAFRLD